MILFFAPVLILALVCFLLSVGIRRVVLPVHVSAVLQLRVANQA